MMRYFCGSVYDTLVEHEKAKKIYIYVFQVSALKKLSTVGIIILFFLKFYMGFMEIVSIYATCQYIFAIFGWFCHAPAQLCLLTSNHSCQMVSPRPLGFGEICLCSITARSLEKGLMPEAQSRDWVWHSSEVPKNQRQSLDMTCMGLTETLILISQSKKVKWATSWENLFMPYPNNKGADQPQISLHIFVVRCLDSIILLLAIAEISSL